VLSVDVRGRESDCCAILRAECSESRLPLTLDFKPEDTFQTLAPRDSCGPTGARLMSILPFAG